MRLTFYFFLSTLLGFITVYGAAPEFIKQVRAVRLTESIQVDGILSESIYNRPGVKEFFQQNPDQGKPATEQTEVWVAYDDAALYIGALMKDTYPDSIVARLSRRDNDIGGDKFAVAIDSYHGKRDGFYFMISAAGTLMDGILYNDDDDQTDGSWNGVWEGKQKMLSDGWSIEMRIPFSQLRFEDNEKYVWGIAFLRWIGRKKEESFTIYTPRNESGFVSRFSELTGIEKITPPSRFEVTPYMTGRADYLNHESGDPFNSGSKYKPDFGIDFKLGLGSNLTIDGAINPDFGQVEVDPAVVNLSDQETYYGEKRPFFLEGMNIFSFGYGGVTNFWTFNWSNPNIFYSRRIGRAPTRGLPDHDFSEVPQGTRILGAAKLTGKIMDGWNVGIIETVTNREYARIVKSDIQKELEVEPLSSYTIARMQRDFNDGKQGIGILATAAHRFFKDDGVKSAVNSDAFIGGLDGWTAFDSDKEYMISGWTVFSHVAGTKERMLDLQQGWPHYFERPDASHLSVDSNATSMDGFAGRFTMNKEKGRWMLNSALGFVSPGFESGDLGYLTRTDVFNYHIATGYKWNEPTEYYRYLEQYLAYFASSDFKGNYTCRGIWGRTNYEFTNYITLGMYYDYIFERVDNQKTRGGPLMLKPDAYEYGFEFYTDNRNDYIGEIYWYAYEGKDATTHDLELYLTMRPSSNISISVGPGFAFNTSKSQWVESDNNPFTDALAVSTYGKRYIFADMNYKELSAQIRVNWTLSPTLSFQMFVQPLFATGDYTNFKEFARPRSFDFNVFGKNGSSFADSTFGDGSRKIYLDADGSGPAPVISMDHPNFSRVSLRGNAVLRWEYMPGSTLYFVWTQSRYNKVLDGTFNMKNSIDRLSDTSADNIFMIKLTYWLGT
jgi:hypothetical protein